MPTVDTGDLSAAASTYTKITGAGAYPIPLLSYDVLCTHVQVATQAKLTTAYIGFIDSANGQAISAKNAGSAPLPAIYPG